MGRRALDAFENREDGSWICIRATTIVGPKGPIPVRKGQTFAPKCVFGGHDDFADYLATVSVERPRRMLHEG